MDIPMLLDIPAAIVPDDLAVTDDGGRRWTYAALAGAANRVADALAAAGLEPGDRVAVMAVNTAGLVAALFGIGAAGGIAVPVNFRLKREELEHVLEDSRARVTIAQDRYAGLVSASGATTVLSLDALEAQGAGDAPPFLERRTALREDGVAALLYTSGTTSAPKGVMLTHGALASYVMGANDAPDGGDAGRALLAAPLYHVAGVTALLNALYVGRRTHLLAQFDPAAWLAAVEGEAITHAFVVPTMLARILDDPGFAPERVASLQALTYGAAPMPPALIERAVERFPATVAFSGAYGQTETSSTVAVLGPEDHRLDGDPARRARLRSVGRVVDGVEARVVGDDGAPLPAGATGEVQLRTGRAMAGYWGPTADQATRVHRDDEGWLSTGDLGRLDVDGYLFLTGRKGDLIIRGGENVAPAEVEAALLTHPEVLEAAVLGVADDEWGERIAAVLVQVEGAGLDEPIMLDYARRHLSGHRRPDVVVFVDELPRSSVGKLLRRELVPVVRARLERTAAT